ncbi:MAG: N-acetylmuramoyl-L-alanine amidase, partial [Anaerolineae bacterium]
ATLGAADFGAAPSTDTGVSDAGSTDDVRGASVDSTVIEADFPFMALAGQWSELAEGVPEVSVSVRTSRDGVRWSEWSELEPDVDMKEPPRGGEVWSRLHVARGTFAQLRLTTLGADSLDSATVPDRLTLHYLDTDAGPTAPRLGTQSTRQTLTVIPRAGWGADESLRFGPSGEVWPPEYTKPLAEIVHHTVTANDPVDPAAIVRSIYYYHAVTRGWGDIGYNFLVDHRGNVYEGRFGGESGDRIVQGGHALQYNVNTIGVAVLGTFTEADQQPRAESLDGLVTVLAHKARRFGIEPFAPVNLAGTGFDYSILGHRDVLPGHTVCPGDGLHELLPQIRTSVDRLIDELSDPGASTDPPPSDTPTSRPPTATRRPPSATPAPPSATPAPPTVTSPPPAGCVEMVADGGFEDGSAAWMRSGAYHTSWDAHSGDWAMFVGLRNNDPDEGASAAAWQDVDGPFGDLGGGSARLAFALRTQAFAGDRLVAHVLDEDGAAVALQTFEPPLSSDWTEYSFDITRELAAAAPGALRLHFAVSNNGDGQRSYMRVDDVSLLVCGTPPPPPQSPAAPSPTPIAATSTPPATAPSTPGAVRCGTLLRDGGFESDGLVTWQLSGDNPARRSTESPHSGDGALVLGLGADDGDDFGYSAAAQLVTFPASTVSARLTLWARRLSTSPEDAFVVELRRTTDGRLERLLGPTLQGAPGGWSSQTVALDPADLDGTVEVYLAVLNRGQRDTSGRTAIAIDDVVLEVCFNAAVASRYVPRAVTAHP